MKHRSLPLVWVPRDVKCDKIQCKVWNVQNVKAGVQSAQWCTGKGKFKGPPVHLRYRSGPLEAWEEVTQWVAKVQDDSLMWARQIIMELGQGCIQCQAWKGQSCGDLTWSVTFEVRKRTRLNVSATCTSRVWKCGEQNEHCECKVWTVEWKLWSVTFRVCKVWSVRFSV